ncbi:glycosyl hydrolase [Nocardioides sp. SOB77]|uniref:Glycosyl hydrolase n=1 Tax=Nocardioides oceani TaxID=3058369 RepID=A0ABT8FJR9_9ACTN|nr:glycosyl hydrolase [Nocardioides oceani]MDN4174928.1 glycosyl hydrolase [Nocardioides oceani]
MERATTRRAAALLVAAVLATVLGVGWTGSAGADPPQPGDRPAGAAERGSGVVPLGERVELGAYVDGMQAAPALLTLFERTVAPVEIASYYYGYGDVFPSTVDRLLSADGRRKLLVSWDMGPSRFSTWAAGDHDAYLDQVAAAAVAFGDPVWVRPWPEMNGDWQDFQPTAGGGRSAGGTYAEFKAAWRHVVDHLRARGATNLRWVFNPTADTYAETTPVERIWPGRRYVDVLGLDGFNWGRDAGWGRWRSFAGIFREQYRRLTALAPALPVWICEVASKEPRYDDGAPADRGRDKAAWVRAMLRDRSMPRIRALVWFHADKERDWRIDSSADVLAVLRRLLPAAHP